MTSFGYDTDTLHDGARQAGSAASAVDSARRALGAEITATPFGSSPSAAALHGAVAHAHRVHALGAAASAAHLDDRRRRVHTTAALGADNTVVTLRTAGGST